MPISRQDPNRFGDSAISFAHFVLHKAVLSATRMSWISRRTITVEVSLCLLAITKSWFGSWTLCLRLINNDACLLAVVIPMGTWALSSCPMNDAGLGQKITARGHSKSTFVVQEVMSLKSELNRTGGGRSSLSLSALWKNCLIFKQQTEFFLISFFAVAKYFLFVA